MSRDVIPEYFPDKCLGCETLGDAITARNEAIDNLGMFPSRKQILTASRIGNIARELCERAEKFCPGLAQGCMFEENNDKES